MGRVHEAFETIAWRDGEVVMIDQRRLPTEEIYLTFRTWPEVADAIRTMVIRGAPAIGIAAGYGVALAAFEAVAERGEVTEAALEAAFAGLADTRPTAVNLFWALDRMRTRLRALGGRPGEEIADTLLDEAGDIHAEDIAMCRAMGDLGGALLPEGARVLTHCNAGGLATGGYGTALGVIRSGFRDGRVLRVYADETRPFLQGARLTAWELAKEGIPTRVITDNMAGHLMQRGEIDAVVVGTDRVAANGDVANKIGTFTVALLARHHGLPFYVAAPSSTIDLGTATGADIPIERRPDREVTHVGVTQIVPDGVDVENPAFDVTPADLVTAIVTERGVARAPYGPALQGLMQNTPDPA